MAQRAPRIPQHPIEKPKPLPWVAPDKDLFARAFGVRIAQAREKAGLTQEQMADQLGIRQSKYSKYEKRGPDEPPTAMPHIFLAHFCEITGANLKELLKDPR